MNGHENEAFVKTQFKILTYLFIASTALASTAFAGGMGGGGTPTPITFSALTDLEYGVTGVAGGSGNIDLATNGTITYGAGYTGSGVGTAGSFAISGDNNANVDVACSATATMTNNTGGALTLSVIELRVQNTGAFGTGATCAGLGTTALTHRLRNQINRNTFFIGARLDGTGGVPTGNGQFSTGNPGGSSITISVFYQ